jgi:hypothetical protein
MDKAVMTANLWENPLVKIIIIITTIIDRIILQEKIPERERDLIGIRCQGWDRVDLNNKDRREMGIE